MRTEAFEMKIKKIKWHDLPNMILICVSISIFALPNFAIAEPRAKVISNINGKLLEEIKEAIGQVATPVHSAYEARRRAQSAKEAANEVLRSYGYYKNEIIADIIDEEKPQAIIKIATGTQFLIKDPIIEWQGIEPNIITKQDSINIMGLKNGDKGVARDILDAEGKALGAVLSHGYSDAQIGQRRIIVDHETQSIQPIFRINAGAQAQMGRLIVNGKTRTRQKWLNKITPWTEGDIYSPSKISELERRLLETGAFDSAIINFNPKKDANGNNDINLTLEDRARISIETELSYSTNEGVAVEGRLGRYNIMGRADSFINRIILGQVEKRLESEIRLPHFRVPNQTLALSIGAFQDDTNAYRETGIDFIADVTRKITRTSFWSAGAFTNIARTREPDFYNPIAGINRNYVALGVNGAFLMDKTDNLLNPTNGYKLDGNIEPTLITGDANLSYVKLVGQAAYFNGFGKNSSNVLAARARFGAIYGGSIPELPSGKRLYAGGGGSVRGYEYQGIGPRYLDPDKTPQGGLSLIEGSLELRHQFKNKFGVVAFLDSGTLGTKSTPNFGEFHSSGGIGIRYDLGFAPIRLDVAVPFDKQQSEQSFQIYIGVGQSF